MLTTILSSPLFRTKYRYHIPFCAKQTVDVVYGPTTDVLVYHYDTSNTTSSTTNVASSSFRERMASATILTIFLPPDVQML